MAEYIEREAVLINIAGTKSHMHGDSDWISGYRDALQAVGEFVQVLPAADVAPVVHCVDCVNWELGQWCGVFDHKHEPDFFCAYGRKQ